MKMYSIWRYILRIFVDIYRHRCGWLLLIVFWPIALWQIILGLFQRIVRIGTIFNNAATFIKPKSNSGDMDDYLMDSAISLSKRIRDPSDSLTSVQLTNACIRQIERLNPYINAVVAKRYAEALEQAQAADDAVSAGTVPSDPSHCLFWGVPILVKECFEVKDMPYSSGIVSRKHIKGTSTAPAVLEAESMGAIVLGVTNTSEGCMWHESINMVYGRTYNPYDFGRTCGGSSGGCGAGVASCMVPMAITSDVGGSTRIPSHYNGVFGHKPTGGSISNEQCFPNSYSGAVNNYCQLGPMSKHAEDLWPLLCALCKSRCKCESDNENTKIDNNHCESLCACPIMSIHDLHAVGKVDITSVEIYFSTESLANPWLVSQTHNDIHLQIEKTIQYFKSIGCVTKPFPAQTIIPEVYSLLNTFHMWGLLLHEGNMESFKQVIRSNTNEFSGITHLCLETFLSIFELSDHTFPAMLLAISEYFMEKMPENQKQKFRNMSKKVFENLNTFLSAKKNSHESSKNTAHRVWIMPTLPTPAPHHNESLLRIFDVSNTGFFNVMQLPVTVVPWTLTSDNGMPIAMQVIAAHGQDHLCIAVAKALQQGGVAGWRPPEPLHI